MRRILLVVIINLVWGEILVAEEADTATALAKDLTAWGRVAVPVEGEPKDEDIRRPREIAVNGLGNVSSARYSYSKYLIDAKHSNNKAGREHQELEKVAESQVTVKDGRMNLEDTIELMTVVLYEFDLTKQATYWPPPHPPSSLAWRRRAAWS
jgi:hypothetical protein